MAFDILLLKEKEDDTSVVYHFGPDENDLGLLWLDKSSGVVKELKQTSVNNSEAFFQKAAVKIRQHWKAGDFPEETCWAS
ncbi:hypothetical protein BCD67_22285 [Oscillatoriales cyanobacterium USR001]|nr:hypothetical protein BCD67_22285 [Oscillatoriales cyanobacterium USR001]